MKNLTQQKGGAALEYLVVSTFALLMGLAAVGFVGKMFREKLEQMNDMMDQQWQEDWRSWSGP